MDWSPLAISVKVSLTATLIVFVVGIPVAWLISRLRRGPRSLAQGLVSLPMVLPPTLVGYYLLVGLGNRSVFGHFWIGLFGHGLAFTWQGEALAASVASFPLLVIPAAVALADVDRDIADCARVFGASEWVVFWKISLPMARNGIAAGLAVAFARALGDFGATMMFAGDTPGRTQTMPLAIYDAWQSGQDHMVTALALVCVAMGIGFMLIATAFATRR